MGTTMDRAMDPKALAPPRDGPPRLAPREPAGRWHRAGDPRRHRAHTGPRSGSPGSQPSARPLGRPQTAGNVSLAGKGAARGQENASCPLREKSGLDQRQRFQSLLFPEGLQVTKGEVRTPGTTSFYSELGLFAPPCGGLVSPKGTGSNYNPSIFTDLENFLRRVDTFRRAEIAA
jgi:hypothetical protein